jgi:hypothetical protein
MCLDDPPIPVHSVAEAYLYRMATPCPACHRGALAQTGDLTKAGDATSRWTLATRCGSCNAAETLQFAIDPVPGREQAKSCRINATSEPSKAIDLLGWLSLFQSILGAAGKATDKAEGRQLAIEAAQCLDEAFKFYGPGEELPGPEAFFSESSRQRFASHPQQFALSRWRVRRLMLPDVEARTLAASAERPRPWWRFWRERPRG